MKRIPKFFLILSLYSLPFILIEVIAQFRYSDSLEDRAYVPKLFGSQAHRINRLHKPNTSYELNYRYLYDWQNNDSIKAALFRTDSHGTIIPSSFDSALKSSSPYTLFCGGSTTENSFVHEGLRAPDVYSATTKIPAVNTGVAGKDIFGCLKTISFFLTNDPKPDVIVIANNVNSLMTFGESITTIPESTSAGGLKSILRSILPGSYQLAISIRSKKPANKEISDKGLNLTEYERGLQNGCCHGAAGFNTLKPQIDWNDKKTQLAYRQYIETATNELTRLLKLHNFNTSNVYFFIEPNSFGLDGTASKMDWRQVLTSKDGRKLSNKESALITDEYDGIYRDVLVESGFNVVNIPSDQISKNDFYDAVHLTAEGSIKIGKFYARVIKANSSAK